MANIDCLACWLCLFVCLSIRAFVRSFAPSHWDTGNIGVTGKSVMGGGWWHAKISRGAFKFFVKFNQILSSSIVWWLKCLNYLNSYKQGRRGIDWIQHPTSSFDFFSFNKRLKLAWLHVCILNRHPLYLHACLHVYDIILNWFCTQSLIPLF